MPIHRVHLDVDGVILQKGATIRDRMRKRDLPMIEGAQNTVDSIMAASDFELATVLTARFERRRQSTIANLSGHMPSFPDWGAELEMVGGQQKPYRAKIDRLADTEAHTPPNVLIDDNAVKCTKELAERLRRNPFDGERVYGGITLVAFGMRYEEVLPTTAQAVRQVGRPTEGLTTQFDPAIGTGVATISNSEGEIAFVVAMPSHQQPDVDAMLDTVRGIQSLVP